MHDHDHERMYIHIKPLYPGKDPFLNLQNLCIVQNNAQINSQTHVT